MKKMDKKSAIVWFIGILFVGSSIGMGLLYTSGNKNVELPKERILHEDLNEKQKALAYANYMTLIYFVEQNQCSNCYPIEEKLKQIVLKYQPYVYLIILNSKNETYIAVDTGNGKKRISSGSFEDIEYEICNRAYFLPQCRDIRALRAISGNETG